MNYETLLPAYGRVYKAPELAVKAFRDGSDFMLSRPTSLYCSIRDFRKGDVVYLKWDKKFRRTIKLIV